MKIIATSDLHGNLPDIPECDLLIIAGDVTPLGMEWEPHRQAGWLQAKYEPWLRNQPAERILWIAGNHDFILEKPLGKEVATEIGGYLEDELDAETRRLLVYGTPWTPNLPKWAFPAEGEKAQKIFAQIPHPSILVSHGPPMGVSDEVSRSGHVGSVDLLEAINKRDIPLVICGHIHEGFGINRHRTNSGNITIIINVSYVDEHYKPRGRLAEIEFENDERLRIDADL